MTSEVAGRSEIFQIRDFETKPSERRKGHGRYLATWLEQRAKADGFAEMWADDVAREEPEKFWTSMGFARDYDDEDMPVWSKRI